VLEVSVYGALPQLKMTSPPSVKASAKSLLSQLAGEPVPTMPAAQAVGAESALHVTVHIIRSAMRPSDFIRCTFIIAISFGGCRYVAV
jgi:hypothetical protein